MGETRSILKEAYFSAIDAASPGKRFSKHLTMNRGKIQVRDGCFSIDMTPAPGGSLFIISSGKAALGMYRAAVAICGPPDRGIIVSNRRARGKGNLTCIRAGHPLPDMGSYRAGRAIVKLLSSLGDNDSLIYLLSGGSSSMVALPEKGVSLDAKRKAIDLLIASGASIFELNRVRRALSRVKGGALASLASHARSCVLLISDVIGNDLETIGSGPFTLSKDLRSPLAVVEHYSLRKSIPPEVLARLMEDERIVRSPSVPQVPHIILADNQGAIQAAGTSLEERGFQVTISAEPYQGDAWKQGKRLALKAAAQFESSGRGRQAFLAGGETTSPIRGKGLGGRNQEMALGASIVVAGREDMAGLCAGTDGIDGNSPAAGAFFDGRLLKTMEKEGLDPDTYLHRSDSFSLLSRLGYSLITGPTDTNVMDIFICIKL